MDDLMRSLAPVTDDAWAMIEEEAERVLRRTLAGRKVVDFSGPHGSSKAAVNLGRVESLEQAPEDGVEARLRQIQPLVEIRIPFKLARTEIDAIGRGADDPALEPVTFAARKAALAEDRSIFHGYPDAHIEGIIEVCSNLEVDESARLGDYPRLVAETLDRLRIEGVDGPYAIVVGRDCYTGLATTHVDGYPVIEDVKRLLDGPIIWAPGVDGAAVISLRGGDFELTVGQDFSVGYLDHDRDHVELYIQESFTFRVLGPEAAVALPSVCR
ncbi:MAG: family 1 encapsulin nanocompartment shell protein [Persicimonas sp.]